MKKYIIFIIALFGIGRVVADEVIIGNVVVPQGGQAMISFNLNNPDEIFTAGQMKLVLPTGVTTVLNENGDPTIVKGARLATTNHSIGASHIEDGTDQFTFFSISNEEIPNTEGTIFSIYVTADAGLVVGTVLEGTFENIELTTIDATPRPFNRQTFTITISEPSSPYMVFDENTTVMPVAAEGVDVSVQRTFVADEWTTICMPFSMTEAQTKLAFGDNVMLADFTSWKPIENEEGNISCIELYFESVQAIEANHPYIINVANNMTEFTVNNVDIDPQEEPAVKVGKKLSERGYMIGSYMVVKVPEDDLFITGEGFYYSDGLYEQKAFRAWFELNDVLSDKENADIRLFIDDIETPICEIQFMIVNNASVYNLRGQIVSGKLLGGIYIRNGKKLLLK